MYVLSTLDMIGKIKSNLTYIKSIVFTLILVQFQQNFLWFLIIILTLRIYNCDVIFWVLTKIHLKFLCVLSLRNKQQV